MPFYESETSKQNRIIAQAVNEALEQAARIAESPILYEVSHSERERAKVEHANHIARGIRALKSDRVKRERKLY